MENSSETIVQNDVVRDFVFDLYQASRVAMIPGEVQKLYEVDFKEITDNFFSSSPWPEPNAISRECNHDEIFLCFYR